MNLTVTLVIVALTAALFAFANWRSRAPAQPLKVRFINYNIVQMACLVVILVMAAHLVTLMTGHPLTSAGGRRF